MEGVMAKVVLETQVVAKQTVGIYNLSAQSRTRIDPFSGVVSISDMNLLPNSSARDLSRP